MRSDVRFSLAFGEGSTLDVVRFELTEGVSQSFRLELELSSPDDAIDATTLLDREAVFTIERNGAAERALVGICTAFEQGETGFRLTRYRAVIESPLARLALRHNSRIFQQVSAPEILATILKEHRLTGAKATYLGNHEPREYATQYREYDDRFVHRLATEEGIVYWHDASNRSSLVLSDRIETGPMLDDEVLYQPAPAGDAPVPHLWHFAHRRQLAPTRVTQRDATFHNPRYDLQHEARPWAAERAVGEYEHYDFPGRYKADAAGKPFTRTKLYGLRNLAEHALIEGDDARLWPGLAFDLTGHPTEQLNARWRVIAMRHSGEQATSQEADASGAEHGTRYRYEATVIPAHYDWKPEPAPRPVVDGPQVAHVVGPPGEEVYPDPHGRVKVQFPWDRESDGGENSSCWIRVSQGWAGAMYGFMAIPRIGHEVIVSFLEGDPDQPIVTGRAYNAANRPPYELPLHKTRTTFKTNTHKGKGYNELRFEDEAGQEEIFVHAQKDQNIVVENDETTKVGHDRSEDVGNDETIQIGHDRTESVGNDETLSIGQDRRETLGRDHQIDIGRSRQVTIGKDLIEDVRSHGGFPMNVPANNSIRPATPTSRVGYTFKDKSEKEFTDPLKAYEGLTLAQCGHYPLGANGSFHGGIHFTAGTKATYSQDKGVRCIADGEVIAYRIDRNYPDATPTDSDEAKPKDGRALRPYSTGFVLVRHRLHSAARRNVYPAYSRSWR